MVLGRRTSSASRSLYQSSAEGESRERRQWGEGLKVVTYVHRWGMYSDAIAKQKE